MRSGNTDPNTKFSQVSELGFSPINLETIQNKIQ